LKLTIEIGVMVLHKLKTTKKNTLNVGGIVCLLAAVYCIYYLLVLDDILPFSISSVLTWSSQYAKEWHILTVGLMPIYLALMIFGTSMFSLYFGSALQRWLSRLGRDKI
jgi:hypothetical protein